MIPALLSGSFAELVGAADGKQSQRFHIYGNADRNISVELVRRAERSQRSFYLRRRPSHRWEKERKT